MVTRSRSLIIVVFLAALTAAAGARAETTWVNPLMAYRESSPPGVLVVGQGYYSALDVKATRISHVDTMFPPGITIPLTVHPGTVTSLRVCYKVKTAHPRSTSIWRAYLVSMAEPLLGTRLVINDSTALWSTVPTCYTYRSIDSRTATVDGALALHLFVVFGSTEDVITIGGIEITMDEPSPPPVMR
jgi:hypothetical protein